MIVKKGTGLVWGIILFFLFALPCIADEIRFQNPKGVQTGVIVGEDNQSMTIRFPKSAIKSVKRAIDESSTELSGQVIWEEGKDYLILKIPRQSIRMAPQKASAPTRSMKPESASPEVSRKNEKAIPSVIPSERTEKVGTALRSGSPGTMSAQQAMLKEEMGSVEGVILWRRKPLRDRPVKIVLERYTGFSRAALEKWFTADKGKSLKHGVVLDTRTDSEGHYIFREAPPGNYRLYWMPDIDTGWIRRLREKPDIEVTTGNLTVENVPEKLK